MVPKGQLEAVNTDVYKLRYALSDLHNLLGASVLSDPAAFKAICDALRGPDAVPPRVGARLLELARNFPPEGVTRMLSALQRPSVLSVEDSCAEMEELRDNNVLPGQLQHVLRLLRQGGLLEQLNELEQLQAEGTSVPDLRERLRGLEHRLELSRQQNCPQPDEHKEVALLRAAQCPNPSEHEEVLQLREDVVAARRKVVVRDDGPAVRAALPPPRPPSPPRPAGIGLLLERVDGEDDVHVKELTPGGAVEKDGRIAILDIILSVDGVNVSGMHLQKVFNLVLGEEGSQVTLQIQRTVETPRKKGKGKGRKPNVGDEVDTTILFVTLTRQHMLNLDHELGHLEVCPLLPSSKHPSTHAFLHPSTIHPAIPPSLHRSVLRLLPNIRSLARSFARSASSRDLNP